MQKLNQVIAVERGIKKRVDEEITTLYQLGQKGDPFIGFTKTYRPKADGGDVLPPESKIVQQNTREVLKAVAKSLTELFDVTAEKDFANCGTKGTVVVDGVELVKDAPVPYLLFLDKYLVHVRTIIKKLPVLSADEHWTHDPSTSLYKSDTTQTMRTQKIKDVIVAVPPTDKHPAQVVTMDKDVQVGTWETTQLSGAMPVSMKDSLLERVEKLLRAVTYAREHANNIEAEKKEAGASVFHWLFAGAI